MPKRELNRQELLNAWNESVERVLNDTVHADELGQEQLNAVAGMRVESGVRGGGWNVSLHDSCNCTAYTVCIMC